MYSALLLLLLNNTAV